MFDISVFNKVSNNGLKLFNSDIYSLKEENLESADGIVLRSYKLLDAVFPKNLKAIARAGAGYNNIPVEKCSENGIVVFNTPGANANGVMELTLLSLLLSSRKVYEGIKWAEDLQGDISPQVEKGKGAFAGIEIKNKTLGVIGLGAIGVLVANMGIRLGMNVIGYDPYMSVKGALGLSWDVKYAESLDIILGKSDYLTLHIPLVDNTKKFVNEEILDKLKNQARLINISRGGLVDSDAVVKALNSGKLARYVTDFPDEKLLACENAICIPHLGASTLESEENCAIMAVEQLKNYLENGNIINSVNFPKCSMERAVDTLRITIMNKNISNMIGSYTNIFAKNNINIIDMINKSKGDYAYNIIDVRGKVTQDILKEIEAIEGIIKVRLIK
ncbi:MAG: 3-phosphoglycerate dehydrogenase [Clostridiales bacterium]|nr:3-phosphoglycerate dehydrogenase [Clostridiales bacterium]